MTETADLTYNVGDEQGQPPHNETAQEDNNGMNETTTTGGEATENTQIAGNNVVDGPGTGGGKRHYQRQGGRSTRRRTPHSRHQRAVFHQSNGTSDPRCRVYVGNLPWEVSWRDLKEHMKTTGYEVTHADVLASHDGRSKGCGLVEFDTEEGAKCAVETLNDTELMGRQIFVREDREAGSGYYTQQSSGSGDVIEQHTIVLDPDIGGEDAQNRRVYVGNLSWDVTWQDLKDHMRQTGDVLFSDVMTDANGRSKGCGIVEYATSEEAQEAIQTLSNTEIKDRVIYVREDREGATGGGGGGGFNPGASRYGGGATSVFVGNLKFETSWQDLKDHMRQAGNVDQANIISGEDGRSKGCGIVQFQKPQEASRAIRELQNSILNGRPIFVREDREPHGGSNAGGGRGRAPGGSNRSDGAGGCQLFVSNLSYDTSWQDLKDHFQNCGEVERADVMEGPDGRKKGFGTVRFTNKEDASNAIDTLNGVDLQGRILEVRLDYKA